MVGKDGEEPEEEEEEGELLSPETLKPSACASCILTSGTGRKGRRTTQVSGREGAGRVDGTQVSGGLGREETG